jgi:hypothetical protein
MMKVSGNYVGKKYVSGRVGVDYIRKRGSAMVNNTTPGGHRFMALVACIAGLLSIIVVPELGMRVANIVTKNASMVIQMLNRPALVAAPKLVSFWYPFWSGLCVIAGTVLLLVGLPIYRGEKWGRPLALGALVIPSVFGIYAFWPITFFSREVFGEIALGQMSFFAKELLVFPATIAVIGILPFFIILFLEKSSVNNKLVKFLVFGLLGITTSLSFMNGHTAMRMLWSNIIADPQIIDKALAVGTVVNWVAVIVIIVGIPLLAGRMRTGWFLCIMGSLAMLMGTGTLLAGYWGTWDFRIGTALTIVSFILLVMPGVSTRLVD